MKMGDGGFRPAYNFRYAVAGSPLGGAPTIVGVMVDNVGSDMGTLTPMVEQIHERTGQHPKVVLADGGFAKHDDIAAAMKLGVMFSQAPIPALNVLIGTDWRLALFSSHQFPGAPKDTAKPPLSA